MKKKRQKGRRKTMTTPTLITETSETQGTPTEGQLVQQVRGERSYREFADYLNEQIPAGLPGRTTYQSISNWEKDAHPVTGECLMAWMTFYDEGDERYQLANRIFALRTSRAHWVGGKDKPS